MNPDYLNFLRGGPALPPAAPTDALANVGGSRPTALAQLLTMLKAGGQAAWDMSPPGAIVNGVQDIRGGHPLLGALGVLGGAVPALEGLRALGPAAEAARAAEPAVDAARALPEAVSAVPRQVNPPVSPEELARFFQRGGVTQGESDIRSSDLKALLDKPPAPPQTEMQKLSSSLARQSPRHYVALHGADIHHLSAWSQYDAEQQARALFGEGSQVLRALPEPRR